MSGSGPQLPSADEALEDRVFLTAVPGQEGLEETEQDEIAAARERIAQMEESQVARRQELAEYLKHLRDAAGDEGAAAEESVVVFPPQFDAVVDAMGNREMLDGADDAFWRHFSVDDVVPRTPSRPGGPEEERATKLQEGMEEIRRLDLLLAEKTKEAKKLSRGGAATPTRKPKEKPVEVDEEEESGPPVMAHAVSLKPEEEERVTRLLDDTPDPGEEGDGYAPPMDEAHRLETIESRLKAMSADEGEWEAKSEGVWRPGTAVDDAASDAPQLTERSVVSSASTYRTVRPPKPGDEYIDEMREQRALRERLREINAVLKSLESSRDVSQFEVRALIAKLMAEVSEEEVEGGG